MSGIVGILNADGTAVDPELLGELTAAQAFRGPFGQKIWLGNGVGLGHSLSDGALSLTLPGPNPNSSLALRAHNKDGIASLADGVFISADVRLDGRRELIGKLQARGWGILDARTDADLILYAYATWGEDCLQHILGDFAFALWDERRRRLLCAVDHFRVKLFYYAQVGNSLVFSNTLDCILRHPLVSTRLSETAIGDFLLFERYQDTGITIYADVHRLPPAHYLTWEDGRVRCARYWSLPQADSTSLHPSGVCLERFDELLTQAVDDRLNGDQIGILLSGGLDSPLLAAKARSIMARSTGEWNLQAFTVVYDYLIPDRERYYAGLVAQALEIPVQFQSADDPELYDWDDPEAGQQPPEPVNEPTWGWSTRYLRQVGATWPVLLTGVDGDTLLRASLQNHCRGLLKRGRLGQLARDLAWYAATTRRLPPIGFRSALRRRMRREPAQPRFPDWLSPDFCRRASLTDRWADYHRPREQSTPRGVVQKQLSSPYWASVFDRYDASWTGSPLEVRHPLMDVRLVTFLAGLPAVPWCVHKELFRRHLENRVPREVHERPKTVLADDPVRVKLARQGVPWKEDTELESEMGGFVNQAALPRYQCHMTVNELYRFLRPYSLNQWLKSRNRRKDSCPIMAKAI